MPPGFEFPHPSFRFGRRADLWVPLALTPEQRADRSTYSLRVIARLRAGVSLAMAGAEMEAVGRRLEEQHPGDYRGPRGEDGGWRVTVVPFKDEVVGDAGRRLRVLLGAVGVLLLIACANVAGLFLARGLSRRRDFATRLALGARRSQLAREALAESLLLALLGGALGLLLASWGTGLLVALGPASVPRLAEVSLDGRVLAFASLLSLATGLASSLLAPLAAARTSLRESLGPGAAPSFRRGPGRSRQVLVVATGPAEPLPPPDGRLRLRGGEPAGPRDRAAPVSLSGRAAAGGVLRAPPRAGRGPARSGGGRPRHEASLDRAGLRRSLQHRGASARHRRSSPFGELPRGECPLSRDDAHSAAARPLPRRRGRSTRASGGRGERDHGPLVLPRRGGAGAAPEAGRPRLASSLAHRRGRRGRRERPRPGVGSPPGDLCSLPA